MGNTWYENLTEGEQFIFMWQYGMLGDFKTALIGAIMVADEHNLQRLRRGFPTEVKSYLLYINVEGWWKEVQDKANRVNKELKEEK